VAKKTAMPLEENKTAIQVDMDTLLKFQQ